MHARLTATLLLLVAGTWAASCSSGLGNDPRAKQTSGAAAATNTNLPVGFDLGFVPTDAVAEPAIAGVVVPAIGATAARDVVLLAFSTAAAADNGDAAGTPLARDTTTDTNGAADVFVAAISAQSIDKRAFSQSLAGKFRHPRCVTCHSMSAPDTTAFASSTLPHAGPPPGTGFPFRQPEVCAPCHVTSNTFPVPGWQSPDSATFDIRPKTVAQLVQMAQNVPVDETEHFVSDKRVLWALDSGVLPAVGGRNGIADDNQDGVLESEDTDGQPRTVPGGSVAFLREIEDWRASGMLVSNAAAVRDVTLVSRQTGTTAAGNGASSAPQVRWVPNPGFDPGNAAATNPIGTLFVAFQSTASNLTAGDANAATDVFRAAVELRAEEDATGAALVGGLNLVTRNDTVLCSAPGMAANAGNGASSRPAIGGANAEFVAFESLATDLVAGFVDGNGAAPDVYLRTIGASLPGTTTQLVSHLVATPGSGGNGASERPALAADGSAIAFESDASDLVNGDGNGVRDVFVAATAASPFVKTRASVTGTGLEGSGGASRNASVHSASGRTRVAFESDKTDLAAGLTAPTNVFLFDSVTGTTQLLNRRVSPGVSTIGNGSARRPVFLPDGKAIAFESEAKNIDVLRADDNRFADVYLVETDQLDAGRVLPFRISVTATEAASSNGDSTRPTVGTFTGSNNFQTGFAAYVTTATNLGTSDTTNVMVSFLDETSGILVDFSAVPTTGLAPLQVQFTDASTGAPTGWMWDFDNDGNVDSTAQNPVTTYGTPGDFTVKLTVRNKNTEADKTSAAFVHVVGPVTTDFAATPTTTGGAPLTVLFTDASTQPNGTISAWAWDFDGDGTTDSTAQNPSHTYATPGTFPVTLTATGESGSSATVTKAGLVTVTAPGTLVAAFTSVVSASPLGGRVGTAVGSVYDDETVQFTDTSAGTVTSRLWNFGDGTTSTAQNPTHVFATPGTYSVFLTVTDAMGTDSEVKPALITSVGGATSVTIAASKDGSIYSDSTGNGNGANERIVCGNAAFLDTTPPFDPNVQQGIRRALIQFDVAAAVPAGSVISSVQLALTSSLTFTNPTGAQTISLRRVQQAWGEGATNGGIGGGSPAAAGDVTWASRVQGSLAWSTPGGGVQVGVSGSRSVNGTGTYVWDSASGGNAGMVADAQSWLDTPANNFGWILRSGEVNATRTTKVFDSRESGPASMPPGVPPALTISFRPMLP
ncbi:MAG: PKD domain-containing protein [Planctomycetes bacterium]|nr:PKD domain-containing protein [Planctomycetota bacterium]